MHTLPQQTRGVTFTWIMSRWPFHHFGRILPWSQPIKLISVFFCNSILAFWFLLLMRFCVWWYGLLISAHEAFFKWWIVISSPLLCGVCRWCYWLGFSFTALITLLSSAVVFLDRPVLCALLNTPVVSLYLRIFQIAALAQIQDDLLFSDRQRSGVHVDLSFFTGETQR